MMMMMIRSCWAVDGPSIVHHPSWMEGLMNGWMDHHRHHHHHHRHRHHHHRHRHHHRHHYRLVMMIVLSGDRMVMMIVLSV